MSSSSDPLNTSPWLWALRALESFRGSVGWEGRLPTRDQLTFVLFGAAQEGKTSLALRLLGTEPQWLPVISEALRGGRAPANSATPVVTIYESSRSKPTNAILKHLEESVREARRTRPKLLRLTIPASRGSVARIVDLVGVEASDRGESRIAMEAANQWLYQADIHVFVSGMDHINDLIKTHNRNVARILHFWQVNQDTSRIVLGKAYETTEAQKALEGIDDPATLFAAARDRCRRVMIDQLEHSRKRRFREDELPKIFPVCTISEPTPKLAAAVKATEHAIEEMVHLTESDPYLFRVRAGFSLPLVLLKELEASRAELKTLEDAEAREVARLKATSDAAEIMVKRSRKEQEDLRREITAAEKQRATAGNIPRRFDLEMFSKTLIETGKPFFNTDEYNKITTWICIQVVVMAYLKQIPKDASEQVDSLVTELKRLGCRVPEVDVASVKKKLRESTFLCQPHVPALEARTRSLIIFSKFNLKGTRTAIRSFRNKQVRKPLMEIYETFLEQCRNQYLPQARKDQMEIERRLDIQLKLAGKRHEKTDVAFAKSKQALSDARETFRHHRKDLERRIKKAERAIEGSGNYAKALEEAFREEWKGAVRIMNQASEATDLLSGLAGLGTLTNSLEQLASIAEGGRE